MNFLETSLLATILASLAVICIYIYLFLQYRQLYLALWISGWILHFGRFAFFTTNLPEIEFPLLVIYQLATIVSCVLLLKATSLLTERNLNTSWYFWAAIATICSDSAAYLKLSFLLASLPTCIYIGLLYCKTGLLFIKHLEIPGIGKYVTGVAFIILGIHAIDLPFLIEIERIVPWGFLVDALLRFVIGVGTLIVFFEKTRSDFLLKDQDYRLLAENASDVIFRCKIRPVFAFDYISPSVFKLTGFYPREFYKSPKLLLSIIYPSDRPLLKMSLKSITSIKGNLLTLRLIKPNQEIVWVEQKSTPIFDNKNTCIGLEGIVRDISSRKIMEQDLSRLDRLNAIGQMAASVAHEIRNPMTTVRGYLQFFSNKQEFSKYKSQFGLLIEELDRTNLIIKEYLSLSQHKIVDFNISHLNSIIESLYPLVKADANGMNKDINLCLNPIPELYIDEKEIRQLILNLVRNGLEAMSSGGIITISTFPEDDKVVLSIKDQGNGIPLHILENIGKPFVSTKENGTGLGLAICYRIAERHQAKIAVKSDSTGTTFLIYFQLTAK
ncbi:PAS domain-containing protein|uniref:histidine kinase n=1 Tax=Dendrosporobacter quercicolus TaxID=146817 RepID=A0A1G9XRP1_9FIRM|nr:PAS domain-containing sensor histidine kinase [Dendrosporobacter quercicolus]NSL49103.1 PAS domain-containing protein [Dendrosporobacter quercicolus DSM 1736]SDM99492.1 Signal transduction histidine kinase [Dendrosporobacter quercicolus]